MTTFKESDFCSEKVEVQGKKFLNNQRVMATYKGHLDKGILEAIYRERVPALVFWRAAHESADDTDPYLHTHVVCDFGKAFQTTNSRTFDVEYDDEKGQKCTVHPNFKAIKSKLHWERSLNYIAKEDTANADLKTPPALTTRVWDAKTLTEALEKNTTKPCDVNGIIALFQAKPRELPPSEVANFVGWQTELYAELVNFQGDDRTVTWIYEEKGGTGKSFFMRNVYLEHPADVAWSLSIANIRDGATVVESWLDQGWSGACFIVNLTRSNEKHVGFYEFLEAVRDGMLTVTKYRGKSVFFQLKKMIIFANWLPDVKRLSLDRWNICRIDGRGEDSRLSQVSAYSVLNQQSWAPPP